MAKNISDTASKNKDKKNATKAKHWVVSKSKFDELLKKAIKPKDCKK